MDSRDSEDMAISSFVIVLKLFNVCSNLRRIGHFVRKLQCNPYLFAIFLLLYELPWDPYFLVTLTSDFLRLNTMIVLSRFD